MAIGFLDQTSPGARPPYARIRTELDNERDFVARLEDALPDGSAVFQLPFVPFPESASVERTEGYDPLKLYLHSRVLRWSAAAFSGRPNATWQRVTSSLPPGLLIAALRRAGFGAVVIDRLGYRDGAAALEAQVAAALQGKAVVQSRDGRYVAHVL